MKSLDFKHIKKMANKQLEHEERRRTDPSKGIESKIHEACCKNDTQKVTNFLLGNDINAKKLDEFGSLGFSLLMNF